MTDCTPEELAKLVLPGDIPGLLRRGSPVKAAAVANPASGVVLSAAQAWLWRVAWLADTSTVDMVDPYLLALDLTDATGRAHAAWWLAAAQPAYKRSNHHPVETCAWIAGTYGWGLTNMSHTFMGWGWKRTRGGQHVGVMPNAPEYLAELDPNDPRTLPDGSRWVDVEALRRVCLHAAGLEAS